MLSGKHIILGVTGGIACYKVAELTSALVKMHADVQVIMTENAAKFITPITFEQLTGKKVLIDTFDRNFSHNVEHISAAELADFVLIAPATANILAKLANGIADDMLTTTVLACDCPKAAAPSMNTKMYDNPVTQDNIKKLMGYGWEIIEPGIGHLACGSSGKGRLPEPEELVEVCLHALGHEKDLVGKRILVTAGPTRESIDPVRYITNYSTGKMGYAVARAASRRGADVTLVSGPVDLACPKYIDVVNVTTAEEMYEAVIGRSDTADIIVMAAAVADYRPAQIADNKIKKRDNDMSIPLVRTPDILAELGRRKKEGQFLCGFSMETEHMEENSRRKLEQKNLDLIAANNVKIAGAGFGVDTNVLTIIGKNNMIKLPLMSKDAASDELLDEIIKRIRCNT